jgi:uncharacterized membrane protein
MKRISAGSAFNFRGRKFKGLSGFKGKPFHPPLTDLPIAAYVIAPILDVIAFVGRDNDWASRMHHAAGYVFVVGAAFSLLTVLTGIGDWLDTEKGSQIRAMANAHALLMVGVTLLVLVNLALRYLGDPGGQTTGAILGVSIAIAGLVTLGGMVGGAMVYDYGFNVRTAKDDPVYHAEQPASGEDLRRTG